MIYIAKEGDTVLSIAELTGADAVAQSLLILSRPLNLAAGILGGVEPGMVVHVGWSGLKPEILARLAAAGVTINVPDMDIEPYLTGSPPTSPILFLAAIAAGVYILFG